MDMSSNSSGSSSSEELSRLARSLKDNLEIKDRQWRYKTYRNCFLHSDAVQWMMTNETKGNDEETAVLLLNELRTAGFIQHVVDVHKPFKVNQTRKLYFCFLDDENSHIRQQQKMTTTKLMKENKLSKQMLEDLWKGSDSLHSLQVKMNRMASSIDKLTETQNSMQTKLEIVHQATISLIRFMVSTALLLLILVLYTLYVIVPTLHKTRSELVATSLMGSILIGAFVIQGSNLFSVWLQIDTCLVQAAEGEDAVENYEMLISSSSSTTSSLSTSANDSSTLYFGGRKEGTGIGRRQSSILLKEPLLRANLSSKSMPADTSHKRILQRKASDIPVPLEWPHRPVLVCVNTPVSPSVKVEPTYGNGPLPIGKSFQFSSELFDGQCLIRLKSVPNSDNPAGDEAYFAGRRRLFQTIVQGKFKEPLNVSEVLTGHEFVKPLQNLPHPWILSAATNLIGKLAPGASICVTGNNPTMLACMAATSQVVRGDEPGNEPDIDSIDDEDEIQEDCSMLGGKFSTGKISATGRKLHLANPQRAEKYIFDTETVYTFDFYQSLLNALTYSLDLGVANIGMAPILNGQPIQCLAKTTDGRYLWSFQIWHESLLEIVDDTSKRGGKIKIT